MEWRNLKITLVSANNLRDVQSLGRMEVYAEVSVNRESNTMRSTTVDREGESNPTWNFPVEYTMSELAVRKPGANVADQLWCKRTFGDRFVGEVSIPVKGLFDMGLKSQKILSYNVAGTSNGKLNILYRFGAKMSAHKPSGWKSAAVGFGLLVLIGGALSMLAEESDDEDEKEKDVTYRPVFYEERRALPYLR